MVNNICSIEFQGKKRDFTFDDILGCHHEVKKATFLANTNVNILILGETGTGKELFAWAIHNKSKQKNFNFVHLNCSTLPPSLLESELFGFKKGSFTGANNDRMGKIEYANRGTLFLDEIGNVSLEVQSKILRVIEYNDISRIGENKSRPIDVRFIFATNVDLEKEVSLNRFRSDLYFRISSHKIYIPPLRKRKQDIKLIAKHYWDKWRKNSSTNPLTNEEVNQLMQYHYPGNIRELIGLLQRLFIHSITNRNNRIDFIKNETYNNISEQNLLPLEDQTKEYIKKVIHCTKSLKEACQILKIDYKTLKKYSLE